jgi:lysozyme
MKHDIKQYEGLRLVAYLCPAGKWTIGYGHTAGVKPGQKIDKATAESYFSSDVANAERWVNKLTAGIPIDQGQYDALVDFVFNFGAEKLNTSTLLKLLRAKNYKAAGEQLLRWVYAENPKTKKMEKLEGLIKRRDRAYKLYWCMNKGQKA